MISVLSLVPDDTDTVRFVENFQMTETLFTSARDAYRRHCPEIAMEIVDILVSWMFKGGRFETGWGVPERSVYGLAILALVGEDEGAIPRLREKIGERLAAGGLPDQEVRDHSARSIRGRAETL